MSKRQFPNFDIDDDSMPEVSGNDKSYVNIELDKQEKEKEKQLQEGQDVLDLIQKYGPQIAQQLRIRSFDDDVEHLNYLNKTLELLKQLDISV